MLELKGVKNSNRTLALLAEPCNSLLVEDVLFPWWLTTWMVLEVFLQCCPFCEGTMEGSSITTFWGSLRELAKLVLQHPAVSFCFLGWGLYLIVLFSRISTWWSITWVVLEIFLQLWSFCGGTMKVSPASIFWGPLKASTKLFLEHPVVSFSLNDWGLGLETPVLSSRFSIMTSFTGDLSWLSWSSCLLGLPILSQLFKIIFPSPRLESRKPFENSLLQGRKNTSGK